MSGNIMYFPISRVRTLDITMVQAMSIVKAIGVGSGAALRGVDLKLPSLQTVSENCRSVCSAPTELPSPCDAVALEEANPQLLGQGRVQ